MGCLWCGLTLEKSPGKLPRFLFNISWTSPRCSFCFNVCLKPALRLKVSNLGHDELMNNLCFILIAGWKKVFFGPKHPRKILFMLRKHSYFKTMTSRNNISRIRLRYLLLYRPKEYVFIHIMSQAQLARHFEFCFYFGSITWLRSLFTWPMSFSDVMIMSRDHAIKHREPKLDFTSYLRKIKEKLKNRFSKRFVKT